LTMPKNTGSREPDSFNLWPGLASGQDSPRTEVVHQVENDITKASGLTTSAAMRMGKYKLILGDPGSPKDDRIVAWPEPSTARVPFGSSGGSRDGYDEEAGLGHCRAATIEPTVNHGHRCRQGCLFNLEVDEAETTNLIADASLQDVVTQMTLRLSEHGATGPPWAYPAVGKQLSTLHNEICDLQHETGYYLPVRTTFTPQPPPAPVPPSPPQPPTPPRPSQDHLSRGDQLNSGESLVSPGGKATLTVQSDGNLVLTTQSGAVAWSSHTQGNPGAYLVFQHSDGNLNLKAQTSLWHSKPHADGVTATLQDDCNFVVLDSAGNVIWSLASTCGSEVESVAIV